MDNTQLLNILSDILQKKGSKFNSNELFGLISLMLLLEIIEIFKLSNSNIMITEERNKNLPSINNLTGLLSQLQGKDGENNNLQQMLPLLLGTLGGNNSNIDIGNLMQLLNSINLKQQDKDEEKQRKDEEEKYNEVKKN